MEKNPLESRPRELLHSNGAAALSDRELMSVILGSGTARVPITELAPRVVTKLDQLGERITPKDLYEIDGMGYAKAALIIAALEFARRRIQNNGVKIRAADDVYQLVKHLSDRTQEHFLCVSLNGAHEVIASRIITIGLVNSAQVHPREVFADPLKDRATAIIVAHNHPSGDLTPSPQDLAVTKSLRDAGQLLGIKLLDHIVFSRRGFYSFAEQSAELFRAS